MATWYHQSRKYFDLIDTFVCTNAFMYQMMVEAGYPEEKLACIPTFTDIDLFTPVPGNEKSDYIIYWGAIPFCRIMKVFLNLRTFCHFNRPFAGISATEKAHFVINAIVFYYKSITF